MMGVTKAHCPAEEHGERNGQGEHESLRILHSTWAAWIMRPPIDLAS